MMKKMIFSIILVFLAVSMISCGSGGSANPNNQYEKYYTGKNGVAAQFQNVPTKVYYYGPQDVAGNKFQFSVEVQNNGASFSRGGIYVSGFDPRMIKFDEIPLATNGQSGACSLSIGSIGFGELGGIFNCEGFNVATNGKTTSINIDSLKTLINGIGERFDKSGSRKDWWEPNKFVDDMSVSYNSGSGSSNFVINFNNGAQVDYFQHGRLFIALLSAIDYTQNGGREFMLAGNTYEFPGGERAYYTYNGQIVDWPVGLDQTTQHLLLTSCYQYTTFADPLICVDPDPLSENRKVCTPKSKTWSSGNGAPVAITSIEQENTPKKIIFHINVKNIGSGTVYDPGKLEKCSPYYPGRVTPEDQNVVYLGDVRIGATGLRSTSNTGGLTCSPSILRLDSKTKTGSTTCTYSLDNVAQGMKSAYETPLVVELWYGYSETTQKDVIVKRVA